MSLPIRIVSGSWMHWQSLTYNYVFPSGSISIHVCTIQYARYLDKTTEMLMCTCIIPQYMYCCHIWLSLVHTVFMTVTLSQCDYRFWLSSDCFNGWKCEFVKGARVRLSDGHDQWLAYLGLHLVRAWKLIWRTVKWDETRSTNECAKHIPQLPAYLQRMTEQIGAPTFVLENPGDEWCTWKRSVL